MSSLKSIVETCDSKTGRVFDIFIQIMIVVSLISFSVETLPELSTQIRKLLRFFEVVSVGIFSIEYLIRLIVADNKLRFFFSFFGLIDLLAILPFYLASGIDLRSARVFRLLRVFRIFKMTRYGNAIVLFRKAFFLIKEELVLFFTITMMMLYVSAVGIYFFEQQAQPEAFGSVFDGLWWAVVTLTTVGYGDVYPITVGGKVFTFLVVMLGLGVVAVPTGLFASALSRARELGTEGGEK